MLHIYLRDHLAVATAGYELSKRSLSSNRGTPLGNFLTTLTSELMEDRDTLAQITTALGTSPDPLKQTAAALGERLGRMKLNGSIRGYSGLSRITELEALRAIVELNRCIWSILRELADTEPRLSAFDLEAPLIRAERHGDELDSHRAEAAVSAFS